MARSVSGGFEKEIEDDKKRFKTIYARAKYPHFKKSHEL